VPRDPDRKSERLRPRPIRALTLSLRRQSETTTNPLNPRTMIMKNTQKKIRNQSLTGFLLVMAAAASTASAATVFNFQQSASNVAPEALTFSALNTATPTDTSSTTLQNAVLLSGAMAGVDGTKSFTMDVQGWNVTSYDGSSNISFSTENATIAANTADGIAPSNGLISANNGFGLVLTFDLSNFSGYTLRLTDFTGEYSTTGTTDAALVVDGVSTTTISGNATNITASGLSIDITDGDQLLIKSSAATTNTTKFRLASFTLEAIAVPEPSSMLLGSLGILFLFRRRR